MLAPAQQCVLQLAVADAPGLGDCRARGIEGRTWMFAHQDAERAQYRRGTHTMKGRIRIGPQQPLFQRLRQAGTGIWEFMLH
ncbi:hypothetical protein FJ934_19920 [Mesorhizobium sp. B2-4-12]|uniref:hypothetical protein n=1 Tax=Mesorhizobium sp. B2-4-12 TaxID=2589937 RepID=UPI00112B533B|nr:hypothetical protein [Mesorhizobium sp. B2-4-12]TPK92908.1 hypothetical protein FJ934_19920 [Mesorhizobium sp. B2-4-12]